MRQGDPQSFRAVCATFMARGDFSYLHCGLDEHGTIPLLLGSSNCRSIAHVTSGTTAPTQRHEKLTTFQSVGDLEAEGFVADLCVICGEGSDGTAIELARKCRLSLGNGGVIVFTDRTRINRAIIRFLRDLETYRAYPLAHDLFVVEINVPSLLGDPALRAQVPRPTWLSLDELGMMPLALGVSPLARLVEDSVSRVLLPLMAPSRRMSLRRRLRPVAHLSKLFEIYTFVTNDDHYERMRESFIRAGFDANAFIRLSDGQLEPYEAITRIANESKARYPILCHQDVRADQGDDADDLLAALQELDAHDPHWAIAGNAGVMRSGRSVRRLIDPAGGPTEDKLPAAVVTLDENFLVMNGRNPPRCSPELFGFHLYATDACLHALSGGGSPYVIDFIISHLSSGDTAGDYQQARTRLVEVWSRRCIFRFVLMPTGTLFLSRSQTLRRLFGSGLALEYVENIRRSCKVTA